MPLIIEPYRVDVPDAVIVDLRERLERTRFPNQVRGTGWDMGTELGYLRELLDYWRDDFDWLAVEARLNALGNFVTEVDGQRVHFLHVRSPEPDALPVVISHGWPGSVVEFLDVIGPLTDPPRTAATPPTRSTSSRRRCRVTASRGRRPSRGGRPGAWPARSRRSWPSSATTATARRAATGARSCRPTSPTSTPRTCADCTSTSS